MKGHKDSSGNFHPHSDSKGSVSEKDLNIDVRGNNDTIKVDVPKKSTSGMKGNRGTFEVYGVTLRIPDKYEVLLTSYLREFVDTDDAPLEKLEKMESEGLLQDRVIKDKRTIYHISQKGLDALYEKGIMGKGFINDYRDVHVAR